MRAVSVSMSSLAWWAEPSWSMLLSQPCGKQCVLLIPESSRGRQLKKAPGEELKVGVDVETQASLWELEGGGKEWSWI